MILTCPSCSARFTINTELIGTAGRKVRCGSCGHTWRQLLTVENDAQPPPQGPVEVEPGFSERDAVRGVRRRSAAELRSRARRGSGGKGRVIAWGALGAVLEARSTSRW